MANRKDRRAAKNKGAGSGGEVKDQGQRAMAFVEAHREDLERIHQRLVTTGAETPTLLLLSADDAMVQAMFSALPSDDTTVVRGNVLVHGGTLSSVLQACGSEEEHLAIGLRALAKIPDAGPQIVVLLNGNITVAPLERAPAVRVQGGPEKDRLHLLAHNVEGVQHMFAEAKVKGATAAGHVAHLLDLRDPLAAAIGEREGADVGKEIEEKKRLGQIPTMYLVVPRDGVKKTLAENHPAIAKRLDGPPPAGKFYVLTTGAGGSMLTTLPDNGKIAVGQN
jgi:hypothetical protein